MFSAVRASNVVTMFYGKRNWGGGCEAPSGKVFQLLQNVLMMFVRLSRLGFKDGLVR